MTHPDLRVVHDLQRQHMEQVGLTLMEHMAHLVFITWHTQGGGRKIFLRRHPKKP